MTRLHFKKGWLALVVFWLVLAAWASERVEWWMGWALVAFGLFIVVGLVLLLKKSAA